MNWQYYYNYLRKIQKTHTTQQYCLEFLKLTNYKEELLSNEDINTLISSMSAIDSPHFNLFPFSENTKDLFDKGKHHIIAQIIYHLPYLDLTWMGLTNPVESNLEDFYSVLLGRTTQSLFYLNNICLPNLLKKINDEHILTYLFILCLPSCEKDTHLWDLNENHICSTPFIDNDNYQMLITISQDTHPIIFNGLCNIDKNLSILLIENFIDIQTELIDFQKINWKEHLPIQQLQSLANINCYPKDIQLFLSNRDLVLYPSLITFITMFQLELFEKVLTNEIVCNKVEDKIIKY